MRYGKRKVTIIMLLTSVLLVCVSCGNEDTGSVEPGSELQTEQENEDAIRRDAEVYAEYEGVSVEEAVSRFELMNDAGPLQAVIKENEESYAGSWIQHQPEYKFVFAFKGDGEEIIKKYVEEGSPLAEKIKILTFEYSYKELEEIRDSIKSAMESREVYSHAGIDMQNNSIDFRFYDKESADKVIRQEELKVPDCVNILQYEGLEIPDSLLTEEDWASDQSNRDELVWSQWWAISVNGSDVLPDRQVTIFLRHDRIVTGTAACNQYWCYYNQKGPYIRLSGAGKNCVGCAEEVEELEDSFLECLRNSYTFVIEEDNLTLYDASGGLLVVLERRPEYPMNPEDLIGTSWQLYSVDGEPVGENETGSIVFDEDGVSLHGEDMHSNYEYTYEAWGDDIVFTSTSGQAKRDDSGEFIFRQKRISPSAISNISPIISYRLIDGQLEIYTERKMTLVFEPFES
jgi:heat shock protein HslJ